MSCFDSGVDLRYSRAITVNYVLGGVSSNAERHGFECVRVLHERFPVLTPEEAGGLYHSFFAFPTFPSVPGLPADQGVFLRQLLNRHSDDPELLGAVASALIAAAERRRDPGDERRDGSTVSFFKERIKLGLEGHPTAYHVVKRLYAGLRRA
jgi:hypothetical protein